jgi:hypothetical protein
MLTHILLGKERENLDADEERELAAAMDSLGTVPGVLSMTWAMTSVAAARDMPVLR